MHVLFAAVILAAFIGGFHEIKEFPEDEINVAAGVNREIRYRENITPVSVLANENVVTQKYDYSCGSAALATLLNYGLGENLSERAVIQGMMKHGDKEQIKKLRAFSLLDMKNLCEVLGYSANGYKAELEDIKNSEYWPCIVPIKLFSYRHFVVLKGVHDGHVFVADPFRGHTSYRIEKFAEMWYQNVIFLVSSDHFTKKGNLLRVKVDDLRYITADEVKDILTGIKEPFRLPPRFERDDVKGEWQYYRP